MLNNTQNPFLYVYVWVFLFIFYLFIFYLLGFDQGSFWQRLANQQAKCLTKIITKYPNF